MGFMQPQIEWDEWIVIDGDNGITFIPSYLVGTIHISEGDTIDCESLDGDDEPYDWAGIISSLGDYYDGHRIDEVSIRSGWGARLSAPGYMDCTEWCVFDTEQEARDYLRDELGDDDDDRRRQRPG